MCSQYLVPSIVALEASENFIDKGNVVSLRVMGPLIV